MLRNLFRSAVYRKSTPGTRMASNTSSGSSVSAVHNPKAKRFEIAFPDKDVAVLEYEEVSPGTFDLYHTEVPPSKQGQGLGAKLADATMEWVAQNNHKAVLSCSYLRDNWLARNPQYKKYVVSNL
eukprot:TRINITY_DN12028_c0_g1_i1.p1 TRINITY_DN12028_c0_g1~~TRINITY_DN12028_c0_g1_i1.p1  ORF type:complete len:125 (-),score=13.58 TRINITY_DN12028_c0_g1_i1:497-871(-)